MITSDPDCGNLVYTASVINGFDSIGNGNVAQSDNTFYFSDFHDYTDGLMTVQVEVSSTLDTRAAYTVTFDIQVIDCELEIMTLTDPGTCPLLGTFPDFLVTYQWDEFMFLSQPLCIVTQYWIRIYDPNGL